MSDPRLPADLVALARANQALEAARGVWQSELPQARRDAVALTTAAQAGMSAEAALIIASWLDEFGGPQPRTYVLADELLALGARNVAAQYLAARRPAAQFPHLELIQTHESPRGELQARCVHRISEYVRGDRGEVRLMLARHLGPGADRRDAGELLATLAAAASLCVRVAAKQQAVAPGAILAREGVAAAR